MSYSELKEQICTNVKKINEIIDDVNLSDKEQSKIKKAFTRHINSDHNGMITDKQINDINSIPGFKEEVKEDVKGISSQLDNNTNLLKTSVLYLEDYKHLVVNNDWTNAINTAINDLPSIEFIQLKQRTAFGGGKIIFPYGIKMNISDELLIPACTYIDFNWCQIIATTPNSKLSMKQYYDLYGNNSIVLKNLFFNGNNIATNGIDFVRLIKSVVDNVWVFKCLEDGIKLDESQWCDFRSVYSHSNGGSGFLLDGDNVLAAPCCNMSFIRCMAEGNTKHGIHLKKVGTNSCVNCTFQFNEGYGAFIEGTKNTQNVFSYCHFEQNRVHVYIAKTDGSPRGTTLNDNHYVISPNVERWVINEGDMTVVNGYCSQENISELYEKNGTKAPFEQSPSSGYIKINSSRSLALPSMVAYSDGTDFTQSIYDEYGRVVMSEQRHGGHNFKGSLFFDASGGENMLRLGYHYLWVDTDGKLRIRNRYASSADDKTGVVVGTQS